MPSLKECAPHAVYRGVGAAHARRGAGRRRVEVRLLVALTAKTNASGLAGRSWRNTASAASEAQPVFLGPPSSASPVTSRSHGEVDLTPSAPTTSPDRNAVRIVNSNARAATLVFFPPPVAMNAGTAIHGTARWFTTGLTFRGWGSDASDAPRQRAGFLPGSPAARLGII